MFNRHKYSQAVFGSAGQRRQLTILAVRTSSICLKQWQQTNEDKNETLTTNELGEKRAWEKGKNKELEGKRKKV